METDWVRVEYFPELTSLGDLPEDTQRPARSKHWTWIIWRTDHLHVSVQWHRLNEERKFWKVYFEFRTRKELREEVLARTLVIPWPRWWNEMVRNSQLRTWRKIGFYRESKKKSIVGKFVANENEQQLKNVKPQETEFLWCELQEATIGHLETDCGACLQIFQTLEKEIQCTRVCEDARFARRVSIGMSYKTIPVPDVDNGFGDRTPACREYTLPRPRSNVKIFFATMPGQTTLGPDLQVQNTRYLDNSGIEIQIPSPTTKDRQSWLVICRGENRYVEELHLIRSHRFWIAGAHRIGKICCKRKRTWFDKDGAIMEHRGNSCEAVEISFESSVQSFRRSYFYWRQEVEWHSCLSTFQRTYCWSREVSKLRTGSSLWSRRKGNIRRCSLEFDGSKTAKSAPEGPGGQKFSDSDQLQKMHKGSNKTRFQCFKSSRDFLLYIRAIQGHTGGNVIAPELMGYVAIPYKWKQFLFSSRILLWCHFNPQIRTHRWRTRKQGRRPSFQTLNPFGDNPDEEEPCDDLSKPRQVHCRKRKSRQDTVHWINLSRAQEKGLQFWQTRYHAIIVCSSVLADCIYKMISQRERETLYEEFLAIAAAATAAARHIGECCSGTRKLARKRTKVPQQITQNYRASGNRCEVLSL